MIIAAIVWASSSFAISLILQEPGPFTTIYINRTFNHVRAASARRNSYSLVLDNVAKGSKGKESHVLENRVGLS